MSKLSRREFLALMGSGSVYSATFWKDLYPFNYLFNALVDSITYQVAHAAEIGIGGNYLLFLHPGAPPRWCMDAFLSPNIRVRDGLNNDEFILNSEVKNTLKDGSGYLTVFDPAKTRSGTTYETTDTPVPYISASGQARSVYLPRLWDVTLPTWNGSSAVFNSDSPTYMRSLARNTCLIRGFKIDADFGHGDGPAFLSQPVPQLPSLSGLVADSASGSNYKVMPGVAVTDRAGRALGFRANVAKITIAAARTPNLHADIFTPFIRNETALTNSKANRAIVDSAFKEAIATMETEAKKHYQNIPAMYSNLRGVDTLIQKLLALNPIEEFVTLKNKYTKLIWAASEKFDGLIPEYYIKRDSSGKTFEVAYQEDHYAEKFAVAEFFIKNKISSSFTFICGGYARPGSFLTSPGTPSNAHNDEHDNADRWSSSSGHSWKYRCFMTCVNELKNAIGPTEWAKTVIQHGAEYARSPNQNQFGSDHAINACSTTIISGAIGSFIPIGNIQKTEVKDPAHSNYGTYGVSAPTAIGGAGTTKIPFEYVVNSILSIFGISSPFRDKYSLLKKVDGTWRTNCEDPKNV